MAERGTERSQAIRPSIAGANDSFRRDLISNAYARREVVPVHGLVAVIAVQSIAEHIQETGIEVILSAVLRPIDGLGEDQFPTQTVGDGELMRWPPFVLTVKEIPLLALLRVDAGTDVPGEAGHIAEQEGAYAESTAIGTSSVAQAPSCCR